VSLEWNSQLLIHTSTFLAINSVDVQLLLCLFWISLRLWNKCLQHPCFKFLCKIAQASKNSDSNAQHFPFGFANTFMISLHALCTPKGPIPLHCHECVRSYYENVMGFEVERCIAAIEFQSLNFNELYI
jgi:hypothetical protein